MKVLQNTGLILLAASLAAATCFKGQGTIQVARDNIPVVCAQIQGQYNPQLGRDACVTDNSNHDHWYFLVKNTNNKNWATVALKDCTDGLMQEIDKCGQKGGKHTSNGIYFEVDPSNGICIDTAYINNHPISSKFRVKREVKIFYDIANSTDVGSV